MAKLALVNREQKRRATVKKYAAKRAELIALTQNLKLSEEDRYESLRDHRTAARSVPQIRPGAQQAARHRHAWRDSRLDQGELVAGGYA
jgi:hypothetical protein